MYQRYKNEIISTHAKIAKTEPHDVQNNSGNAVLKLCWQAPSLDHLHSLFYVHNCPGLTSFSFGGKVASKAAKAAGSSSATK